MTRETSDAFRFISMLAVCAIHATSRFEWRFLAQPRVFSQDTFAAALNQFCRFAVPAFLFLSGLALATKYRGRRGETSWVPSFYRDRLVKIGIPYLAWTIAIEVASSQTNQTVGCPCVPWRKLAFDLIRGEADYHLYFFPVLFQCYILFPLLLRWNDARLFLALALTALALASPAHVLAESLGWAVPFVPAYVSLYWLVYFHLGIIIATRPGLTAWLQARAGWFITAVMAGLFLVLAEYLFWSRRFSDPSYFNHFHRWVVLFYAIACVLAVVANDDRISRWFSHGPAREVMDLLASVSFLGFLMHTHVLRLIEKTEWKGNLGMVLPGLWLVVIAVALLGECVVRSGPLRLLFGLPARRRDIEARKLE